MPTAIEILLWSLTCSIAALAVLAFKALFRHRLGARVHFLLWGLLFLRLVVPVFPSTTFSAFNLIAPVQQGLQAIGDDLLARPVVLPAVRPTAVPSTAAPSPTPSVVPVGGGSTDPNKDGDSTGTTSGSMTLDLLFVGLWGVGAFAVLLWFLAVYFRLRAMLRRTPDLADERLDVLLEEAMDLVHVRRRRIRVVELASARTPYISGVLRPVLVLPEGTSRLSEETLRQVLVHELVHLGRGDVWVAWLTLGFTALHWFNPFLWHVFRVVRQDLEIACDEKVLQILGEHRRIDYGETLLAFASPHGGWVPGSTAMASGKGDLSRRIRFLAFFRKPGGIVTAVALVLAMAIGVLFLTDALPVGDIQAKPLLSKQDIKTLLQREGISLTGVELPTGASSKLFAGLSGDHFTIHGVESSYVNLFVCRSSAQREEVAQAWNDFAALADFAYPMDVFEGKNVLLVVGVKKDWKAWFDRIEHALSPAGITDGRPPFSRGDVEDMLTAGGVGIAKIETGAASRPVLYGSEGVAYSVDGNPSVSLRLHVFANAADREKAAGILRNSIDVNAVKTMIRIIERKNFILVLYSDDEAFPLYKQLMAALKSTAEGGAITWIVTPIP